MDELTHTPQRSPGTEDDRSEAQPTLPLDLTAERAAGIDEAAGVQKAADVEPLPFDDEADHPVGMTLTARAKRVVASHDLPALRIVTEQPDAGIDDPSDTRPSRARAMRRAGRTPARIAEQLGVDELLVRAWVEDVAPRRSRRSGRAPANDADAGADDLAATMTPEDRAALATAQAMHPSQARRRQTARREGDDHHRTAFELARAAARDEARRRHLADPVFAGGIGLVAGVAEIDAHAVTIATPDAGIAAAALRWLRSQLEVDRNRVRLVLRIGPRVAGDLAAHRWSRELDVPRESVAIASWRQAPGDDAEQVLLRIADPTVAATVAGWRDALLAPPGDDPADVAF
jgi:hypothetical protein